VRGEQTSLSASVSVSGRRALQSARFPENNVCWSKMLQPRGLRSSGEVLRYRQRNPKLRPLTAYCSLLAG
jgi:hypothetical protein